MPWYTTADARRDAEKQAASKKRGNAMSYTFEVGKSGAVKATHELGAVELVPHWTWHAVALRQLIAERDTLRARLAAIEAAPTVAMLCPLTESAFNESTLMTAYRKAKMPHVELIARPAKD